MRFPGMRESFPMYLSNIPHVGTAGAGHGGTPDHPYGNPPAGSANNDGGYRDPPFVAPEEGGTGTSQFPPRSRDSIMKPGGSQSRPRGESLSNMSKRVDFSLGMKSYAAMGDLSGDVYEDRNSDRPRMEIIEASRERERERSEARASQERLERARGVSQESARTSARDQQQFASGLARRSTTDVSLRARSSLHRNRFFGRPSQSGAAEVDEMERGIAMAGIPEEAARRWSPAAANANANATANHDHLDPRSGTLSAAAWRTTSAASTMGDDHHGVRRYASVEDAPEGHRSLGAAGSRAQTSL